MSQIDLSRTSESEADRPSRPQFRIFYGWWMVLAGTAIFFVSSGIGFYGHGVILDPLVTLHGWSKATISSAVTLYFLSSGIFGIIIGRLIDKYGPRWILINGSVIFCLGFILLSRITETWQLYGAYLILSIGFCCTSLVPVNTLITNWFIKKRGFAMSLANTGLSLGGIVLVPFATYAIAHWGLKTALLILGMIYWIVVTPTALFFVKQRPSDVHQLPDGDLKEGPSREKPSSPLDFNTQMQFWSRTRAIKTVAFWAIVIAFMMALAGQIAFLMHQMSFLSQYLGRTGAATAVSITAAASIAGRLFLGTFVDRCDKRYVSMACFLIQGAAVISLAYFNHVAILYLGTFAFGLTMGAIIMMQSLITGECFGIVSFATVSGMAGVFTMSGAAFGPAIAGFIFDITGSYQISFTIFAAFSVVAAVAVFFAKPPQLEN